MASNNNSSSSDNINDNSKDQPVDATAESVNEVHEQIRSTIYDAYVDKNHENGLEDISSGLEMEGIRAPNRKITVMIVGNHSAGKSSFINWYCNERIQEESMAMETSGFTFITSGSKRERFDARFTMSHAKIIDGIGEFEGVMENLTTEVSTSTARNFQLVDFIDTPGLTDGELSYPFPINDIIAWLAVKVDLVFVFMDPHGQATCKRTMEVVKLLNDTCRKDKKSKLHYFLTKADEMKQERERSKVIAQLTQNLSLAVSKHGEARQFGEHALAIRTIYRPNKPGEVPARREEAGEFNQIYETCDLMNQSIKMKVQKQIHQFDVDCQALKTNIDQRLTTFENNTTFNRRIKTVMACMNFLLVLLPFFFLSYVVHFLEVVLVPRASKENLLLGTVVHVNRVLAQVVGVFDSYTHRHSFMTVAIVGFLIALGGVKILSTVRRKLTSQRQVEQLRMWHQLLVDYLRKPKGTVYKLERLYQHDVLH